MANNRYRKNNEQLTRRRSSSCQENSFEVRLNSNIYQLTGTIIDEFIQAKNQQVISSFRE